jgi:Protein of unknown function (DUF1365)
MTTATSQTEAPASLYFGDVMHARLKPIGHRFCYRVMSLLIDLNRLGEAGCRRFSVSTARHSTASTRPIMASATAPPWAPTPSAARASMASA